jgi:CRISPR-associated protein Cas6
MDFWSAVIYLRATHNLSYHIQYKLNPEGENMPKIDVWYRIRGGKIPADHGYHLFSVLSRAVPCIHEDAEIGIYPIPGKPQKDRSIELLPNSALGLRVSVEQLQHILPLVGKELDISGFKIKVGNPQIQNLIPSPRLYSRLVIIKGYMDPEGFLGAANRQLKELGVRGRVSLVFQPQIAQENKDKKTGTRSPFLRRTLCIRDKQIVGFAVRAEELTAEESILLQERGLGGRRRFGCGIFIPDRS